MRKMFITGFVIALLDMPALAAVTVDFDDLPFNNDAPRTSVDSRGFNLTADAGHSFYLSGSPTNNRLATRPDALLTMTKIGGGLFGIEALDLDGLNTQVMLTGFFSGGGSTSQTFTLDGLTGLQTFHPMGFSGLSSVVLQPISGQTFSVDNIVTPEPGAAILLVSATALLTRRKK